MITKCETFGLHFFFFFFYLLPLSEGQPFHLSFTANWFRMLLIVMRCLLWFIIILRAYIFISHTRDNDDDFDVDDDVNADGVHDDGNVNKAENKRWVSDALCRVHWIHFNVWFRKYQSLLCIDWSMFLIFTWYTHTRMNNKNEIKKKYEKGTQAWPLLSVCLSLQ